MSRDFEDVQGGDAVVAVMWFRRDLRLADNPALVAAADVGGGAVVPLFVLDPALWHSSGPTRRRYLAASLDDLSARIGGLQLRRGRPVDQVVSVARAAGADTVHISSDYGPYGRRRDEQVARALAQYGIDMVASGSPYAVPPGAIHTRQGRPYQVFTPFCRAWRDHGWPQPFEAPVAVEWTRPLENHVPFVVQGSALATQLPAAGEEAALDRWRDFVRHRLSAYDELRDRPDREGSSRMSVHLKWGEIHPRTLLADLAAHQGTAARAFVDELGWREFYADVLWHRPETARSYLRPEFACMTHDDPGDAFDAWQRGRTGYPIVDAGMRQLRLEGWMHNRVRMIAASFLVKDLHVEWQYGARHFLRWLVDGDLASNQHGWQWVAGCGTDAAPYFRIFNPVAQGRKFDPGGDYVRRYVPELRGVAGAAVHEPWRLAGGPPQGYPSPIVDHRAEREEALRRYQEIRRRRS